MSQVNVPGIVKQLGAKRYIVPALNLKSLKVNKALLGEFAELEGKAPTIEVMSDVLDSAAKIIHLALQRNYPDMTLEEVEDAIDLDNYKQVIEVIMGQSGLEKRVMSLPQEVAAEGETTASSH